MKRKNILLHDFFMEIKATKNRFVSILLIVLLGVSFFSGVRAASPDMRLSADRYYDDSGLMDIRVLSTLGMTEEDCSALKAVEGVKKAVPGYSCDVLLELSDAQAVVKLMSLSDEMNIPTVKAGRLPEKPDEIFMNSSFMERYGYKLGDRIQITSGNDTDISETLNQQAFTITGFGSSPFYLSLDFGSSEIGNGTVSGFGIVLPESFSMEAYTAVYLSIADADVLNCYNDGYDNLVDAVKDRIEAIADKRCKIRYDNLHSEAQEKISDGAQELSDAKKELADAGQKLRDGRGELEAAEAKIKENEEALISGEKKLLRQEETLTEGQKEIEKAAVLLKQGKQELQEKEQALQAGWAELEAGKQQLAQLILSPEPLPADILEQMKAQLAVNEAALKEGQKQLDTGKQELQTQKKLLSEKQEELKNAEKQIAAAKKEISEGKKKLEEGKEELKKERQKLLEGEQEYQKKKAKADEEIANGEEKLADAKEQLENLKLPEWYVLDRNSIQTFVEYGMDSERIEAIGNVFPLIFFLVAALVCLTTMTRMVEEKRTEIGTLKALGYSNLRISGKYLGYAFFSSLVGSILGLVLGQKLLPVVIIDAYGILYNNLPATLAPLHPGYSLSATAIAISTTTLSTFAACYRELSMVPAQLMRPQTPKNGKRILLEHIGFLWKHLSFTWKSTMRNLFRYKKRFFMTVLGIGGCMGLLLTGFGIKDSIMAIGELQFGNITMYSASITPQKNLDAQTEALLFKTLTEDKAIQETLRVKQKSVDVSGASTVNSVYLVVPENAAKLNSFICLKERLGGRRLSLNPDGVILTEKLAKLLAVAPGDSIKITGNGNEQKSVTVSAITENYFFHYMYMTAETYQNIYGENPEYSDILILSDINTEASEEEFRSRYMNTDGVANVTFTSSTATRVHDMLKSMDTVIYVIVLAAGLLAFVVLYNLNNINISERKRELATLKVLGFYNEELSEYVLRENICLTLLGTLAGIGFGLLLHGFVIQTVEIDIMMFGRNVKNISYIYSILLTFCFSFLVNVAMHFKLRRINMVESLKSVE